MDKSKPNNSNSHSLFCSSVVTKSGISISDKDALTISPKASNMDACWEFFILPSLEAKAKILSIASKRPCLLPNESNAPDLIKLSIVFRFIDPKSASEQSCSIVSNFPSLFLASTIGKIAAAPIFFIELNPNLIVEAPSLSNETEKPESLKLISGPKTEIFNLLHSFIDETSLSVLSTYAFNKQAIYSPV